MNSPTGRGKGAARPYFFLSYAHTPRVNSRGVDPNHWVGRLYADLCEAILQITDLPAGDPIGFMDRSMHQGQKWAERLSWELANCRVFVPLYSPRYFKSEACGKEWYAFTRRSVYQRRPTAERATGIVPALWVSMDHYRLPRVASELQFSHDSFGADYAAEGLYALMKIDDYRSQYATAVLRLAQRIVDVADQTVIPVSTPLDFEAQPSAFEPPEPNDRVRISVYSYREPELPPHRSPSCYGQQRTDWQPFRPPSRRPLVDDAADVARSMGFQPSVFEFEDEAEALMSAEQPLAPSVLLVDRWAFLDSERSDTVRQLDRRNPSWLTVLEPWNRDDQQCRDNERLLNELGDGVLPTIRAGRQKPSLREEGSTGVPGSLDEFRGEMERAVMRASTAYEQQSTSRTDGTGSRRPRLGT